MSLSKKLLSLSLCAIIVLGSVAVGGSGLAEVLDSFAVKAEAATVEDLKYRIEDGVAIITDCDENASGDIVIPTTIEGYPVTEIGSDAFCSCSSLTSITIPNGVKSIGRDAFSGCTGLTDITIPNSVTDIGDGAFRGCTGLTSITIPDGVTSIGSSAFWCCTGLTDITIPDSVTYIGGGAFEGVPFVNEWTNGENDGVLYKDNCLLQAKESLSGEYTVEDGTRVIAGGAFSYCYNLTSLTIPDSVKSIGDEAFRGCTGLTSITIPDGVESIGEYAFSGCTGLTSITIPDSVTYINSSAFSGCTGLTSITIPDGVESIGRDAFYYCTGLTSITIPDGVESIGRDAFSGCTGLTSITIPNGVKSIGSSAFWCCTGLTSITIPDSVTSIGEGAFHYVNNVSYTSDMTADGSPWGAKCANGFVEGTFVYADSSRSSLLGCSSAATGDVQIPNSVTQIGDGAFYRCSSLTSITIPDSVKSIGEYAFSGCTGLTSITIPDGVESIGRDAFYYCTGLTSITIPNSVKSIGEYAFSGCTGLTSITIPDGVESIGRDAFSGCTGLTSITIPNGVKSIGRDAFFGCTGLTSITIPDSVKSIGEGAFHYVNNVSYTSDMTADGSPWGAKCANGFVEGNFVYADSSRSSLLGCSSAATGDVQIPNSVTQIGEYAFLSCTGLTSITIPDGVESIGEYAFSSCTGLTSITIPNGVKSIGQAAFYDCTGLTSITIPDSVKSIGQAAFYVCTGLTSITIPNSVKSIGEYAFSGCTGLTSITIPDGVESIGEYAISGCTGLTSITIPDSVKSIGEGAFYYCTGLTSITIPDSVTSIDDEAFSECDKLESIHIPSTVTFIGHIFGSEPSHPTSVCSDANSDALRALAIKYERYGVEFSICQGHGASAAVTQTDTPTGVSVTYNSDAFEEEAELVVEPIPDCVTPASSFVIPGMAYQIGLYSIYMRDKSSGAAVQPANSKTVEVTIPIPEEKWGKTFSVFHIDAKGNRNRYNGLTDANGFITLTVPHFSYFFVYEDIPMAIKNYTPTLNVDYKATLTFSADNEDVDAAYIHWFVNGKDVASGKKTYTLTQVTEKSYTVQAKVISDGEVLSESKTETVNVKTGFFAALVAFFRGLFKALPEYVDNRKI